MKHAFTADNLLGLVFKIVSDEPEPIDSKRYSIELQGLITWLLQKDPEKRPSVREILKLPLIRQKAQDFQSNAKVERSKTIVYVKNIPKVIKQSIPPEEQHLTPK